jgi:hypothetical protein
MSKGTTTIYCSMLSALESGEIMTGPFAARKTFVETLPSLMRRITPSPRLPTAMSVLSA